MNNHLISSSFFSFINRGNILVGYIWFLLHKTIEWVVLFELGQADSEIMDRFFFTQIKGKMQNETAGSNYTD